MTYTPYSHWTREELFSHCKRQCIHYGCEDLINEVSEIIYDLNWNPIVDYDGCTLVQDKLHPYVPCLIHDYDWLVNGGGIEFDRNFVENLCKFGMERWKVAFMFMGVRMGWILWYKWKYLWKRLR